MCFTFIPDFALFACDDDDDEENFEGIKVSVLFFVLRLCSLQNKT